MGQAWASVREICRKIDKGMSGVVKERILAISGHLTVSLSGVITPKGVSSVTSPRYLDQSCKGSNAQTGN